MRDIKNPAKSRPLSANVRRLMKMARESPENQNVVKIAREFTQRDVAYCDMQGNIFMAALDKDYTLQQAQRELANHVRQRAQAMLLQLSQEKNLLYQKVGSFRAVASHLEQLERQLRSSMPQHVLDMLGQQAAFVSR